MLRPDLLPPATARALYRLNLATIVGAGLCLLTLAMLFAMVQSPWLGALAGLAVWSGAAALMYCQRYRAHVDNP